MADCLHIEFLLHNWYNGKKNAVGDKVAAVAARLPTLRRVLIVDYLGEAEAVAEKIEKAKTLEAAIAPYSALALRFERLPFAHPLYILFSSGTTGVPKCIVHCAGGVLLHPENHMVGLPELPDPMA